MRKNRKYKNYKNNYLNKPITNQEIFLWVLACFVFYFTFWFYSIFGFINHCIIEYPVRINTTCWDEQKPHAKEKASESASLFIP
ncbi:hypothetical protein KKC45_04160 [Patescibacteria group bacterium]|nr:hypothetical protein [Patescibacteria group bacterium]